MPELVPSAVIDAGVFIAVLNREEHRVEPSRALIRDAENGQLDVYMPMVGRVEILGWTDEARSYVDEARRLSQQLLDQDWITWVEVDGTLSDVARDVVYTTGIRKGVDGLYVATAHLVGASVVYSWDDNIQHVEYHDVRGAVPGAVSAQGSLLDSLDLEERDVAVPPARGKPGAH